MTELKKENERKIQELKNDLQKEKEKSKKLKHTIEELRNQNSDMN